MRLRLGLAVGAGLLVSLASAAAVGVAPLPDLPAKRLLKLSDFQGRASLSQVRADGARAGQRARTHRRARLCAPAGQARARARGL